MESLQVIVRVPGDMWNQGISLECGHEDVLLLQGALAG